MNSLLPMTSLRSSRKLKLQRSTRRRVGVRTLFTRTQTCTSHSFFWIHRSLLHIKNKTSIRFSIFFFFFWNCKILRWFASHMSAFMVQCDGSSEIQGLLGRQPCIMGSWSWYCSLYFTKLRTRAHTQERTRYYCISVVQIIADLMASNTLYALGRIH